MEDGQVIPDDIRSLLERRTTFQEWLSRLGDLGSEFRPEVADKVRTDYEDRLREVEGELEGHRSELESALGARRASVADIAERHDSRAAELEECELRYRVGEFDEKDWERRRDEHQSDLDALDAELTTQRAAVGALESVLGELTGAGATGVAAAIPRAGAALEAHDEVLVEPAVDVPPDLPPDPDEVAAPADAPHSEDWASEPFEVDDTALAAEDIRDVVEEPAVGEDVPDVDLAEQAEAVDSEPDVVGSESEPALDVPEDRKPESEPAEFMDELEFLESLSLEDADSFDAVSALLDDEEASEEESSEPKTEGT